MNKLLSLFSLLDLAMVKPTVKEHHGSSSLFVLRPRVKEQINFGALVITFFIVFFFENFSLFANQLRKPQNKLCTMHFAGFTDEATQWQTCIEYIYPYKIT
jgi:hypothetical protein